MSNELFVLFDQSRQETAYRGIARLFDTVLADEAIPASEIDVSKAEQDLREAQEQMAHPDADIEALLIRYRNATARIETARQGK